MDKIYVVYWSQTGNTEVMAEAAGHEEIRTELCYTKAKLERIVCVVTTYSSPVCKDTEEP